MKVTWTLALVLAIALAITACGSSPRPKPAGHPCDTKNFYMQCVAPPGGLSAPAPGASLGGFGIDFAWGGPWGTTARSLGARFGASYLSGTSKDWSYALSHSYVSAGLGVVFVWESSAARSLAGWNAGYSDAWRATHEANALGFHSGHVDFASDFDTTFYGSRFVPYYQGAAAWDRRVGFTTGAYGGLHTVATLCNDGVTTLNWQTIAWSGGRWVSAACAPLRQTSINNRWHGYSADYDYAVASNYGQSNFAPPVPPTVCFGRHATPHSSKCRPIVAEVQHWRLAAGQSAGAYRARGCRALSTTGQRLQRRWVWFHDRLTHHPRVKTARRRKALTSTSRALRGVRRVASGRRCSVFASRVSHYSMLISQTEKRYS